MTLPSSGAARAMLESGQVVAWYSIADDLTRFVKVNGRMTAPGVWEGSDSTQGRHPPS